MKLNELFLAQVEREAAPTRRMLERVPEGKNEWRPHPRSMALGYLAALVAIMPAWIAMMVDTEEHDILPVDGKASPFTPKADPAVGALPGQLDDAVAAARRALAAVSEERLAEPWRLLVGGQVVLEQPRYVAIADAVSHLAHHRGQLTVYLRLNEVPVPAIYGPSADDGKMG